MRLSAVVLPALLSLLSAGAAIAQGANDPSARIAAQKEAMRALSSIAGEWRGPAKSLREDGGWHEITQTERMGSMLDGTLKVIEGRGFDADGKMSFNAFAVISYDPDRKAYTFQSYAAGRAGAFPFRVTLGGYAWEIPAGPDMTIHYDITVKDGVWTEIGTRVPKAGPPVKFFEMKLTHTADTDWPMAGALGPKP